MNLPIRIRAAFITGPRAEATECDDARTGKRGSGRVLNPQDCSLCGRGRHCSRSRTLDLVDNTHLFVDDERHDLQRRLFEPQLQFRFGCHPHQLGPICTDGIDHIDLADRRACGSISATQCRRNRSCRP